MRIPEKPIPLSQAKARLGALCAKTLKGHPVRITTRGELFTLVHVPRPEIVPMTDPEFRACYSDPEEIALLNCFGKESDK